MDGRKMAGVPKRNNTKFQILGLSILKILMDNGYGKYSFINTNICVEECFARAFHSLSQCEFYLQGWSAPGGLQRIFERQSKLAAKKVWPSTSLDRSHRPAIKPEDDLLREARTLSTTLLAAPHYLHSDF